MARISGFRQKEVINISDGKRLGFAADADIDETSGSVLSVIIPISGKMFGIFGKENEYIIPWSSIKRIGDDIILVDFPT